MNKSGKMDALGVILIVLAAVLVFQSGALNNLFPASAGSGGTGTGGGTGAGTSTSTVTVVGAPCTQSTTLTVSTVRRYTEVAQTAQNATILQNSVLKGTIAHGSSTTVQSGSNADELEIFPGLQSTTFYPRRMKGKLTTCTGSATTGDQSFVEVDDTTPGGAKIKYGDDTGLFVKSPNKLVQIETAPTITIVNDGQADSQTDLNQVSGENLSIGSGASGSVTVKYSPSANVGWGIHGNVLACQYPSGTYDPTNPIRVTVNGAVLDEADVKPSSTVWALIQSNNTVKSFKFPGIDARKTGDLLFSVKMTADPNDDPASILDRINCTIADVSYYQKQNTGAYVLDIENRDTNVDLGGANTISDFVIGVE